MDLFFAVARWLVYHWGGGGGGGGNTLIAPPPPPPPTYTHVAFLSEFLISVIKHYYKVGPEIISYYYLLYYLWSDTVARIAAKKHAYVASGAEYCHNLERLLRAPLFNLDTSVNGYDNTLVSQPAFWMGKGHASSIPPPPPPPPKPTQGGMGEQALPSGSGPLCNFHQSQN